MRELQKERPTTIDRQPAVNQERKRLLRAVTKGWERRTGPSLASAQTNPGLKAARRGLRNPWALLLVAGLSASVAACGSATAQSKTAKRVNVGVTTPVSPKTSPEQSVPKTTTTEPSTTTTTVPSKTNIRLVYTVQTPPGATGDNGTQTVAVSGDKFSYKITGTDENGAPNNVFALVTPSESIGCQPDCQPQPRQSMVQVQNLALSQFLDPLNPKGLASVDPNVTFTSAPDQVVEGREAHCITFKDASLDLSGSRCAAAIGGFLVSEVDNGGSTYMLKSVGVPVAADFQTP